MAVANTLAHSRRYLLVPTAVVLLSVGCAGRGSHEPAASVPAPGVAPARIPYLWDGELVVGSKTLPGDWDQQLVVHGAYAVAELYGGPTVTTSTLVVLHRGVEVARLKGASKGQDALLSWDGTKLAYLELRGTRAHLVLRDLVAGRELGRLAVNRDLFTSDRVGSMLIDRLDDDGTLHYSNDVSGFAWSPGGSPVPEKGRRGWQPPLGFPSPAAFETQFNVDSSWGAWLQAADGAKRFAKGGHATTLKAQRPGRPASRIVIRLPQVADTFAHNLRWETRTTLLVDMETDTGRRPRLVRCSIVTRRCEDVPTPARKG